MRYLCKVKYNGASYLGWQKQDIGPSIQEEIENILSQLLDETSRIMKAQSSRGVDFERGGLITKIKGLTSLIIPLFVSAFQRSEELADAMEVRGYNPRGKRNRLSDLLPWYLFRSMLYNSRFPLMKFYDPPK